MLILVGVLFALLLILVAYREHKLEEFATLQSTHLLGLMNSHLESEQELSRNIAATAQAEVDEGQKDFDQATLNERATTELSKRKTNMEEIRTKLDNRIPPA